VHPSEEEEREWRACDLERLNEIAAGDGPFAGLVLPVASDLAKSFSDWLEEEPDRFLPEFAREAVNAALFEERHQLDRERFPFVEPETTEYGGYSREDGMRIRICAILGLPGAAKAMGALGGPKPQWGTHGCVFPCAWCGRPSDSGELSSRNLGFCCAKDEEQYEQNLAKRAREDEALETALRADHEAGRRAPEHDPHLHYALGLGPNLIALPLANGRSFRMVSLSDTQTIATVSLEGGRFVGKFFHGQLDAATGHEAAHALTEAINHALDAKDKRKSRLFNVLFLSLIAAGALLCAGLIGL
jgi:hypothetical protein